MNSDHKPKGVLLFPASFQLRQDHALPTQRSLSVTKWFWRGKECWRNWLQGLYAPFLSAGALFGFLTVPIFLFFVFTLFGEKAMMERSQVLVTSALAAIFALPAWAILNAFFAPFRVIAAERKVGAWEGTRFIYFERKLLGTSEFKECDNGKEAIIVVKDMPPGTVIDYKIEIDGPASRLNCIVFGAYFIAPISEMIKTARFAPHGKVVLRKNGSLRLICHSLPSTIPALIRVYALSWDVDPTLSLEYTDQDKGARIVIRPPDPAAATADGAQPADVVPHTSRA